MDFIAKKAPLNILKTECIVLTMTSGGKFSAKTRDFDKKTGGLLRKVVLRNKTPGNLGETLMFQDVPGVSADRVLLVGIGEPKDMNRKIFKKVVLEVARELKKNNIRQVVCDLLDTTLQDDNSIQKKIDALVRTFESQNYTFLENKSKTKNPGAGIQKVVLLSSSHDSLNALKGMINRSSAISRGMKLAKDLANRPGNICTPKHLANEARKLGRQKKKMSVKILEERDMKELGMGALMAVSQGSIEPAKLIILNYKGSKNSDKPIVLVGKGVTFDSGGISLKPGTGMDEMKYDMAGGAAVFGCMEAISSLEPKINVVGIVPATENMPDGGAIKPGDIIKSMSGKTIEILNTDAEGRLILCDALSYCARFKPESVIDIATLTGACVVALGKHATGLLSNNDKFAKELLEAGLKSDDRAWQLPLWEEYRSQLNSPFADIANVGGRAAGTITAGMFLAAFTQNYKWAHLDIAGTAWDSGANKGASGRPVPLLIEYVLSKVKNK